MTSTVVAIAIGSFMVLVGGRTPDGSSNTPPGIVEVQGARPTASSQAAAFVSWLAPQTNTNGTALTNIAGYYIHYGTKSGELMSEINVRTPGLMDYVVQDLSRDTTYYFAVSVYNSAGVESNYSAIVSVTTS